jgi:hypothetical protein
MRKLGLNEKAQAEVGDAFVTFSLGQRGGDGRFLDRATGTRRTPKWTQHWGGVIAKSGGDTVTFENYARNQEDRDNPDGREANVAETRGFFRMVGSKAGQTWHDQQKADFVNPLSTVYRHKPD